MVNSSTVLCAENVVRGKYYLEIEMPKASWAGKIIADSDRCVVVEGNQYFPLDDVKKEFLKSSKHTSE